MSCQSFGLGTVTQKNGKRTIFPPENKTVYKIGLLSAESWKKISGKSTDNVVLKHLILMGFFIIFILKQLSALIFLFFFFYFVLAFFPQHNTSF